MTTSQVDPVEVYGRSLAGRMAAVVDAVHDHGPDQVLAAIRHACALEAPEGQPGGVVALIVALAAAVAPAELDEHLTWVNGCDPNAAAARRRRPAAPPPPQPGNGRRVVLNDQQVGKILARSRRGESDARLAVAYGTSRQHVWRIRTGRDSQAAAILTKATALAACG